MPPVSRAKIPLLDNAGAHRGELRVHLLPHQDLLAVPPPLVDTGTDVDRDPGEARFQLLEGEEYRFELSLDEHRPVQLEPRETITLDTEDGRAGRLRPGLSTGQLSLEVLRKDQTIARAELEVRSRKLDYRRHYRWMLRDVADAAAELIMARFAASSQRFEPEGARGAITVYQRFEFVSSLLEDEALQSSIRRIILRPYVSWSEESTERPLHAGLPIGPRMQRALSRPGPRVETPKLRVAAAPIRLPVDRAVAQLDNPANQFVKYVLTHWRNLAADVATLLFHAPVSPAVSRGIRQANALRDQLDAWLGEELFREVGELRRLSTESQVLQKREGYRDLFRAFLQAEVAAQLSWSVAPESYLAGQRNVATLYEYWVFLQLGKIVGEICEKAFSLAPLIKPAADGFTVDLHQGKEVVLKGEVVRKGRRIRVELWFNRTFNRERGAWTRPMRPDCSVLLSSHETNPPSFEPVWLHFDAKYRVDDILRLFGSEHDVVEDLETDTPERRGTAKAADLLKMHSYRDAIRRSAGAYVVYPGTEPKEYREFQELLPGLGAFALIPTSSGYAQGASSLRTFIDAIIDHVAEQVSQHERARYWTADSFAESRSPLQGAPLMPGLRRPPADTLVLLGYVKSTEHLRWIRDQRLYNLRAGRRRGAVALNAQELAAEFVLLYGSCLEDTVESWRILGRPQLATRGAMLESNYPNPAGAAYFCLPLEDRVDAWGSTITRDHVTAVLAALKPEGPFGQPVAISLESFWRAAGVAAEKSTRDQTW